MSEEEKLKAVLALGVQADEFLSNAAFKNAVELVKADLFKQFRDTKFKEQDQRDEVWRQLKSLDGVLQKIERVVRDGELAQKTLLSRIKNKIAA